MSAINANIIVDTTTLTLSPSSTTIGVTVDPVNLSIFTSAGSSNPPGGLAGELQFNGGGNSFGGLANSNVSGGNLTFENLANLKIVGGSANYGLITDGLGNLSWSDTTTNANFASYAGNVTVSSQPNITSTGTLTGLTVSGVSDLGPEGNVRITGGTNGYILQTDGAGFLSWVAQTGGGIGNPGGSNTQIQYNKAGIFGGDVGFTFDEVSGIVNMPTDLVVASDITASSGLLTVSDANVSNQLSVTGTTSIQQAQEKVKVDATPATGTINYDLLDQAIVLNTADATGNFVLNFRGNATTTLDSVMSSNQSMTCTFINENGALPYYLTGAEIDSVTTTIEFYGGVAPAAGTQNAKDYYTFNIIKTAPATFTLLGATGNIA